MTRGSYPYQFPHVSDEHLRAIGHLALQWTNVDARINLAIGYAAWRLGISPPAVESTSSFRKRIRTWRDYGLRLFPDESKEINSLCGTAANLHDKRNAIFHGYLTVPFPEPKNREALVSVRRFIAKPGFPTLKGLTPEGIEAIVQKMGWLDFDLQQFYGRVEWFSSQPRDREEQIVSNNLVHNERLKLAATFLNNAGVAVVFGGVFGPLFAARPELPSLGDFFIFAIPGLIGALGLMTAAQFVIGGLKDKNLGS